MRFFKWFIFSLAICILVIVSLSKLTPNNTVIKVIDKANSHRSDKTEGWDDTESSIRLNEKPEAGGAFEALSVPLKKTLDDDWCIPQLDLTEDEMFVIADELREWNIQRGDIYLHKNEEKVPFENKLIHHIYDSRGSGYLLEPYIEKSESDLWQAANRDDKYAMLTLLNRASVRHKYKKELALKLLSMGLTKPSLQYLSSHSIGTVMSEFSKEGDLSPLGKEELLNLLMYVELGLRKKETGPLVTYLSMLSGSAQDVSPLRAYKHLPPDWIDSLSDRVDNFIKHIDTANSANNHTALSEIEIPDIAQYGFDRNLAKILNEYEGLMHSAGIFSLWSDTYLAKNECIQKHLTFAAR